MNKMSWNTLKDRQVYIIELGGTLRKLEGFDQLNAFVRGLQPEVEFTLHFVSAVATMKRDKEDGYKSL